MILKNENTARYKYPIIILIVIFLLLTISVFIPSIDKLDRKLTGYLYYIFDIKWLTFILKIISKYTIGTIFGAIAAGIIILVFKGKKTIIIYAFYSVIIYLSVELLKFIIHRPQFSIDSVSDGKSFSFPSGHSVFAFFLACIFTKMFSLSKPLTIAVYLFASLVAFSRVYFGRHYFLDTVSGGVLGILSAIIYILTLPELEKLINKLYKKYKS
jgi:undecaprenyl-diphosphatase